MNLFVDNEHGTTDRDHEFTEKCYPHRSAAADSYSARYIDLDCLEIKEKDVPPLIVTNSSKSNDI